MWFDVGLAIVGVIATIIVGWMFSSRRLPANLKVTGTGTSGAPGSSLDVMATHLTIQNDPSIWKFKIKRDPIRITMARLYDPEYGYLVGSQLCWHNGHQGKLETEIQLESNQQGRLFVFAKERHASEFHVFTRETEDRLNRAVDCTYSDKSKKFSLVLGDADNRYRICHIQAYQHDQSVKVRTYRNLLTTWKVRQQVL